jgi:predicted dehydrogenase
MSQQTVRVGLVGLGFAAFGLKLPSYAALDDVEIVAVADPSADARARAAEQLALGEESCHADFHALLQRGDVDVVDLSTPHATHADLMVACVESGVAAICDKPLAMSLAEADRILGAAERAEVVGGVHRNFRWFPSWQLVWELLGAGAVGEPRTASLSALGLWAPGLAGASKDDWRISTAVSGGGIVIDYGMHLIYLAREALGQGQPKWVRAVIDNTGVAHGDVEDRATLVLEWETGARALLDLSWGTGTTGEGIVTGADGTLKLLHEGGHAAAHNVARGVSVLRGRDDEDLHPLVWQRDPFDWYYGGSIGAFADAVRGTAAHGAPTLLDGRADLEVALAAYESAALGGAPVELPLLPSDPVYQRGAAGVHELDLPPDSVVARRKLFTAA